MKKIIPVLLALLLLSGCVRSAEPPSAPEQSKETEAIHETAAPEKEETDMIGEKVTLDGIDSYLRLTLPEGWTVVEDYLQSGQKCLLLVPPTNDAFQIRVVCWDTFGMCGTGVTLEEKTLPNGLTVTVATEESSDGFVWNTVILPPSTEQFTLQFYAQPTVIEDHQAEIDAILDSLHIGELAHIPPQPTAAAVDK